MIAVIAGNKREFDDFVRPWLVSQDIKKFKYVSRINDVRGVNFSEVIRIGTYFDKRDGADIFDAAIMRIK
jgi:hypothetical protein